MDSNRLSSEPYFNPQQPGTVCIAMDRYGHYRPSSENALRFLQQDDVETGVRHFLDDNVKAASLCTYVPDVTRSFLFWPRKAGCRKRKSPLQTRYIPP